MNGQYNVGDVVLQNWTLTRLLGQGSYPNGLYVDMDYFVIRPALWISLDA